MTPDEVLEVIKRAKRDQVTELDLSGRGLRILPPEIGQLTGLQSLDLSHNQLSQFPVEIGQLTSLQSLDLSDNQLSQFPPEITQLSELRRLDLRDNNLSLIPPEVLGQEPLYESRADIERILNYFTQLGEPEILSVWTRS